MSKGIDVRVRMSKVKEVSSRKVLSVGGTGEGVGGQEALCVWQGWGGGKGTGGCMFMGVQEHCALPPHPLKHHDVSSCLPLQSPILLLLPPTQAPAYFPYRAVCRTRDMTSSLPLTPTFAPA